MTEISRSAPTPPPDTAKVLQLLARRGFVDWYRGATGGFRLARPADAITLYDVVVALGGEHALTSCAVGLAECSDCAPCPLHDHWKPVRQLFRRYLASKA